MASVENSPRSHLSCSECRRRKARCDRINPCSNCAKHRRVCTYEKTSRTPLTRQYVSEIEKELERARRLLARQQHAGLEDASGLAASATVDQPLTSSVQSTASQSHDQLRDRVTVAAPAEPSRHSSRGNGEVPTRSNSLPGKFSLEAEPPRADFDWDERVHGSIETAPDGMAALGSNRGRGYLGVASGAAFLRLTDTESHVPASDRPDEAHRDVPDQEASIARPLTSLSHLEPFIDAYFQSYHLIYPLVHESTFRAQFMDVLPRPRSQAWEVLAYVIATVGAFADSEATPTADEALFESAKARLSFDLLETGNLTLVQSLVLISNYVQKRNKPNSGYNYMGLAKRMAMGIGLHKEFPAWRSKPLMLEIRRRVWWCLFNFDAGAIVTFSRPYDLPAQGVEIELPLNVSDVDITPSTTIAPPEAQTTTLYTHLRCQAKFHLVISDMYSRMIALPYPTAEEMIQFDDTALSEYKDGLPPFYWDDSPQPTRYRFPHHNLRWRIQNFRILMFRAFVLRNAFSSRKSTGSSTRTRPAMSAAEDEACRRCAEAAETTIRSISAYWQSNRQTVLTCWYSLYFLFQAVMVPVTLLRNSSSTDPRATWREQIHTALNVMNEMTTLNSTAIRYSAALHSLCGQFLGPDSVGSGAIDLESPQTQLYLMQSMTWPMSDTFDAIPLDMSWYQDISPASLDALGDLV